MTAGPSLRALWRAFVPPARREQGLVLAPMDDELLVYDESRHRAHALDRTSAQVLQLCDGRQSIEGVARQLAVAQDKGAGQLPHWQGCPQGPPAAAHRQPSAASQKTPLPDSAHGLALQEALVWLALLQLGRARLLAGRLEGPSAAPLPTRRELLRQLGQAAVALPMVASIVAPTAMDTVSCSLLSCASKPCCISKLCSGPPSYLCV